LCGRAGERRRFCLDQPPVIAIPIGFGFFRYVRFGPCIEGTLRLKFQFPRAQEILGSSDKLLNLQHSSGP
jgi:hypothetical protein